MWWNEAGITTPPKPTAPTGMNTHPTTPTCDRPAGGNVDNAERNDPTVSEKTRWSCPRCGVAVTMYVPVSQPPTHRCARKLNQTLPLQKEEGK